MVTINYVIATYSGRYPRKFSTGWASYLSQDNYLKYHLSVLDRIPHNLTQITIMKPKIDGDHCEIPDYYSFDHVTSIKSKIKLVDCENRGMSYGQLMTLVNQQTAEGTSFDYTIFVEDDYVPSLDHFDTKLVSEYVATQRLDCPLLFLCAGLLKTATPPFVRLQTVKEESVVCADFALGIFNRHSLETVLKTFTLETLLADFNLTMGASQVYFSYYLVKSGLQIKDYCDRYFSIFYENCCNDFFILNYIYPYDWRINRTCHQVDRRFQSPIFLPIQIFFPKLRTDVVNHIQNYLTDGHQLTANVKRIATCITDIYFEQNFEIQPLQLIDYKRGYLDLMKQLTGYDYPITENQFQIQLSKMEGSTQILVIKDKMKGHLVGAGTIVRIEKLHNNPVGQIEDVVIDVSYRKKGLGQYLIRQLKEIGLNQWECYKVTLNALDHNTGFYINCGFVRSGNQFKCLMNN